MEALIHECEQARDQGRTPDELIRLMHERGLTIAEAIKMYMRVFSVSLGEAKVKVATSPCWRGVVEAAEPIHNQLAESAGQCQGRTCVSPLEYRQNRAGFPASELARYRGQWVAFSSDGRRIIAGSEDL